MAFPDLLGPADQQALWTTLKLAGVSVVLLLLIATPIAWKLAFATGRWKAVAEAMVALPLVLPPTVMGFYLLILMGPAGPLGAWWVEVTGSTLAFSFEGLVIASVLHSLPFAVQPLQTPLKPSGGSGWRRRPALMPRHGTRSSPSPSRSQFGAISRRRC